MQRKTTGESKTVFYTTPSGGNFAFSGRKKSFLTVITTVCTHELTTFLDPGCEQKFGNKRDAVVCAGQMAADFIEWVKKQNFYHNTVITVPGDHVVRGKNSILSPKKQTANIFYNH